MTEIQQASLPDQQNDGFYSSTAGTYFADKEALQEHYRSDFHRYNLKRKVASLPPVTREWFDARKQQLNLASSSGDASKARHPKRHACSAVSRRSLGAQLIVCGHSRPALAPLGSLGVLLSPASSDWSVCRQVWYDPLTRKKFSSEAKYREATGSKKYRELVRRSGVPAPEPMVTLRRSAATGASFHGVNRLALHNES